MALASLYLIVIKQEWNLECILPKECTLKTKVLLSVSDLYLRIRRSLE